MEKQEFIERLRNAVSTFADGVQDDNGAWTVKGFIDTHRDIYTISTDTKVVSKIVELYIFPTERPATGALYEDDGVTFDFQKGVYALTNIEVQVKDGIVELTINQPKDSAVKTWQATIALPRKPAEIRLNGKAVPFHWDEERMEAKTV